eukprot:735747_1
MSRRFRNVPKAEGALGRAINLESVNQSQSALEVLQEFLNHRRLRYRPWQEDYVMMMQKFSELSVKLMKNPKEGLMRFRNLCQQTERLAEFATVLKTLVSIAEKAGRAAVDEIRRAMAEEDEKLKEEGEEERTEEETAKIFQKRQFSAPALKYNWSVYRTILDILRNNSAMDASYQEVTNRAVKFCLKLRRTSEFRKLCDRLQYHLVGIMRQQNNLRKDTAVNLSDSGIMDVYLATRFRLLDAATELDMWTEANRIIEFSIHPLMELAKRPLDASLMLRYYSKLAEIYAVAGNFLFHAYCVHKHWKLAVKSEQTTEVVAELATACVLSALSIPREGRGSENSMAMSDVDRANLQRAKLLGLEGVPRRSNLLVKLADEGLLDLKKKGTFYDLLENQFDPLFLGEKATELINALSGPHALYADSLTRAFVLRALEQLTRVYTRMDLSRLARALPCDVDFETVERMIMENAAAGGAVNVRIDHVTGTILFEDEEMESARMRNQLTELAKRINGVYDLVCPHLEGEQNYRQRMEQTRQEIYKCVRKGLTPERAEVFKRMKLIESRKQKDERNRLELRKQESDQKKKSEQQRVEEERIRLQRLAEKRSRERDEKEEEERKVARMEKARADIAAQELVKLEAAEKKRGKKRGKKKDEEDEGEKVRRLREMLESGEVNAQELGKAKKEADLEREERLRERLSAEQQNCDYFVRACRREEIASHIRQRDAQRKALLEQRTSDWDKYLRDHRKKFELELEDKQRMFALTDAYEQFHEKLVSRLRTGKAEQLRAKQVHDETRAANIKAREELLQERAEQKARAEEAKIRQEEEEAAELVRIAKEREAQEQLEAEKAVNARNSLFGSGVIRKKVAPPSTSVTAPSSRFGPPAKAPASTGGRFGSTSRAGDSGGEPMAGRFGGGGGVRTATSNGVTTAPKSSEDGEWRTAQAPKRTSNPFGTAGPAKRASSNPFGTAGPAKRETSDVGQKEKENRFSTLGGVGDGPSSAGKWQPKKSSPASGAGPSRFGSSSQKQNPFGSATQKKASRFGSTDTNRSTNRFG